MTALVSLPTDSAVLDAVLAPLPKVCLHDHLDGGLRPATVLELAEQSGHRLPAASGSGPMTAESLAQWFYSEADSGSLVKYIATFEHTIAVMQTEAQLQRVAREFVLDLADDGVVYGEVRYAPELHLERDLSLEQVIEAVQDGFAAGVAEVAEMGRTIRVGTLLTGMRHAARSEEIAELAVRYRDQGMVGFDIAGAEAGFPPSRHLGAFEYLHRQNMHVTIHAGEAFGLKSIWEAVQVCGAERLGHGVRIVEDIEGLGDGQGPVRLGQLAGWVRDRRIPLELCPISNLMTGAAKSIAEHPITLLKDLGFRVTLNTDNRLMSDTSLTKEMSLLVREAGWTLDDLRWVTVNGMKSAFIPFDERLALINDVIKPGYDKARMGLS